MAVRTITTRLALDGEAQFKQAMTSVNASLRAMKSELALSEAQFKGQANTVEALTAKDKLLRQEIEQQTEKVKALEQALKDAAQVYGEDSTQVSNYQAQLNRAKTDLVGMNQALEQNSRYLEEAKNSATGAAASIDGFGNATTGAGDAVNQLAGVLQAAGVAYALNEIAGAIRAAVDASLEFETAMANVNKVAKLSDTELAGMADAIKELSAEMPATTSEIAQVAEASARLGIAKENLIDFSKVMLDLGNVSDLSSDQAATALARFSNITGTAAEDYGRLGSVVVSLGNNFATSESEIVAMSSRLAAAGELAGLSEAQIMGLAAAMTSVGIEAEAGGTAMTQTLTAMEKAVTSGGAKLEAFAQVAGVSSQEFSDAWKNDPILAIQAFIDGLAGLDEKGESATQVLEELGLSGIRQANMLKSLALANETLNGTLTTANQAWIENTELAATAAAKYDTTQAKLDMAANAANNLKIAIGDQLSPALGILADAGTNAFTWAEEFVRNNPILIGAMTAVVSGMGVMVAGFGVYAAKAALATVATTSWGAALLATPIGPVAVALGVLVGAVTAVSSALNQAKSVNDELRESLEASQEAYQDTIAAAQDQGDKLMDSVSALEALAEVENKSAVEKETLLALVESLNEAVPNLSLAYDAQTDSLNLTGEAVRKLAQAEIDRENRAAAAGRMKELLIEEAQIRDRIKDAIDRQSEAEKERDRVMAQIAIGDYTEKLTEYDAELEEIGAELGELNGFLADNKAQQDELISSFDSTADSAENVADALSNAGSAAVDGAVSAEELAAALAELEDASLYLAGAQDTLAKALKEQEAEGSLSLKTTLSLIEAGYEAALAADEETGAVLLNKDSYVRLTQAKIDDQLAALETQRQSIITAARLESEALSAQHAGSAYWEMAAAKLYAEKSDTSAIDAQIAAMNRLKNTLGQTSAAVTTASRRSSAASKQAKTQAQQDLEAYKQLKAELDHQKTVDLVGEEEYYRRLAEYRDRYLTDDANVSEYRKVTEQIYKYDKALADQEAALWADQTDTLVDELEQRIKSVTDQQDKMEDRLSGYGDLFEIKDNDLTLNSIQDQIDAINDYEDALTRLKERNISGGLMDEVLNLDVESATQYARELLSMSEEQWEQYNDLWDEKQQRAIEVAEQFFKDQLNALETDYTDKLGDALDNLTDTSFGSGVDTAQGLIDGLSSMEGALYDQAEKMAARVSDILAGAGRIPSNSELAASFSTERIAERFQGVTNQQLQNATVGAVNAINAGGMGYGSGDLTLKVNLNGRTIAEETLEDFRTVGRERPETLDDK